VHDKLPFMVFCEINKLPFFLEAETSERRRFLAALGQDNQLDRASTYDPSGL
jgi:hypothetical protein